MEEWDDILRELADDPGEYERQAGKALLVRQGKDLELNLRELPGLGLAVETSEGSEPAFVPIATYIQRDLLELPRLARQLTKVLDKLAASRLASFVEGPAQFLTGEGSVQVSETSVELRRYLERPEPGVTALVQLMATAGQGKTVLLDQIARENARAYQPEEHPIPLVVPVDLLGRYVGTLDDPIAGSLNNTYKFPALTQRDVALSARRRWLILALDGFDELVARIGVRDAFLRLSELLDQLRGSGSLVVSARESFFELYQVTSAIRTYLQPKRGSYATAAVKLLPWSEEQGIALFRSLGSLDPAAELRGLLAAFEGDTEIVLQPFFLTRLAHLWRKGERFVHAGEKTDRLSRTHYVIENFIHREAEEKWIDKQGNLLLDVKGHTILLAVLAEEMWRSGAFRLSHDEVRIASEIAIEELTVSRLQAEDIIGRTPYHAALQVREGGISFLHDRFLHFFLGYRLAGILVRRQDGLAAVLAARELSPSIVEWIVWNWSRIAQEGDLAAFLARANTADGTSVLKDNLAMLTAQFLRGREQDEGYEVTGQTFAGDALTGGVYTGVRFSRCQFWDVDLGGTVLERCLFEGCEFGNALVNSRTRLGRTRFRGTSFTSLEVADDRTLFAPEEIYAHLGKLGAEVEIVTADRQTVDLGEDIPERVRRLVERFVRVSEKSTDVAVEELVPKFGSEAQYVARVGLDTHVLKRVSKQAHGPARTLVRFEVDRSRLLPGQRQITGDRAIDAFWATLRHKYGSGRRQKA